MFTESGRKLTKSLNIEVVSSSDDDIIHSKGIQTKEEWLQNTRRGTLLKGFDIEERKQ